MSIGGENEIGKLNGRHVRRFAEASALESFGLDGEACIGILASLAENVPAGLRTHSTIWGNAKVQTR